MIKCVMFDLDGTLLDTLSSIAYNVNKILQKHSIEPITTDECRSFVGSGARILMERALKSRDAYSYEFFDRLCAEFMVEYNANPNPLTKPYDGIEELIESLRERGVLLAVVSNKPNDAAQSSVKSFFGDSFSAVRGGVDGTPLKPDPTSPLAVASEIGVSAAECAYVGDSEIDILTGKNMEAGVTVGVSWGFRDRATLLSFGADAVVDSISELKALLLSKVEADS